MSIVAGDDIMEGILRCSRYAFGPNRLHYCGPDANKEMLSYVKAGECDAGLEALLKAFSTMYPYLRFIAEANKISDPFNNKVVEAYWIGNELLERIEKKKFYLHLLEDQKLKKRLSSKIIDLLINKLRHGAVPHHSFHVFNIWKRTGNLDLEHTLESMDSCRISSGIIKKLDGPFLIIESEPLIYKDDKLMLGAPMTKKIVRYFNMHLDIEEAKVDDVVSVHWGVPCEIITQKQASVLKRYTLCHINLANQTI